MVDPRTPVLIGAGQLSNRVDRGADVARAGRPHRRGAAPRRRGLRRRRRRPHRRRRRAHRRACSRGATATRPRWSASGWAPTPQATSVTGMGGNGPQSLVNLTCLAIQRGRRRPRPPRRRRGVAHPDGRPVGRRRPRLDGAGRRRARGDQVDPRGADVVAGRAGPRRDDAGAGVPAVRAGPPRRARAATSTSTSSPCPSCGRGSARWPPPTRTRGSRRRTRAEEIRTPVAGQPDDRLPVHEAA